MAQGSTQGSSSSSLSWTMVAAVCAMAVLFGAGVLASSRVLSSMVRPSGSDNLTVHTRAADLRLEKPNEIGPGLPLYPHAALLLSETNTGEPLPHAKHAQSQMTTYYTGDVPPLVDSWYLQHLSGEFVRQANENKGGLFSSQQRAEQSVHAVLYALDAQMDAAPAGRELDGIGEQIPQDLL